MFLQETHHVIIIVSNMRSVQASEYWSNAGVLQGKSISSIMPPPTTHFPLHIHQGKPKPILSLP